MCLNTVSGRTIYKIMVENLIVSAITFHGGTNVIGYPWGSNNHIVSRSGMYYVANEAPDHVALDQMGKAMFDAAGGNIQSRASNSVIAAYILGDMTSTVYPVGGGMEDWGYGAGWDNAPNANAGFYKCNPQTEPKLDDSFFKSQENVRAAVYLIETDGQKDPREATYGAREIISSSEGDLYISRESIENEDPQLGYDGHINRNIRLATAMIDLSKPYIYIKYIQKV